MQPRIRRSSVLALCLGAVACGGGGGGSPPAPPPAPLAPAVLAMTTPLSVGGAVPFSLTGQALPGADGDPVTVRLEPVDGLSLGPACAATLDVPGVRVSAALVTATLPAFVLTRDVDVSVRVTFPGSVVVSSTGPIARLLGVLDAALDQDLDGVPDACDRYTYTFEGDVAGTRPAEVRAIDGDLGLRVVSREGELAAAYDGSAGSTVSGDSFQRLDTDLPQQDVTVWLDVDATAGFLTLDLWSEGSLTGLSGAALLFQIASNGQCFFYERLANGILIQVAGPTLPASRRLRLHVTKGAGTTTALTVDTFAGGVWTPAAQQHLVTDDRAYRGLGTVLSNYGAGARGLKRLTVVPEIPAAALTLAKAPGRSMDWQVFQRGAGGTATIPLRLLVRLPGGGRAEARVVLSATGAVLPGHDWSDHGLALGPVPAGRVDLDVGGVPAGGNYDVQARLLDAGGAILAQTALLDVAVGDVWLAAGQSNMSGYSGNLLGVDSPIPEAHVFHNDGTWQQAREPMDDGNGQLDLISREFPVASCLLAFAKRAWETTGVPVGVVPAPLGGTNLYAQWQRNAAVPDARQTLYGSLLARARRVCPGTPPRGFLWFQGESDALSLRTTAQYRADLEVLIANLRSDLAAPSLKALVGQLGTYSGASLPEWLAVQEAQRQAAEADPHAALTTSVDLPRADAIHFNVAGYRTMGARFAVAARQTVFGSGQSAYPRLIQVQAATGSDQVTLSYGDAVTGGAAALYLVSDSAGALTVSTLLVSGSTVTLTLSRPLASAAVLAYGASVDPAAAWVRRVSDSAPAACFASLALTP